MSNLKSNDKYNNIRIHYKPFILPNTINKMETHKKKDKYIQSKSWRSVLSSESRFMSNSKSDN